MFTLYSKEGCHPCISTKQFLDDKKIVYKVLNIKDNDKDGTQYAIDDEDNKIDLNGIIKIFPTLAIGNDFLFGEADIIKYFTHKYINLLEGKFCPEVNGECKQLQCKKYNLMSNNGGLVRGNCNDNWLNTLIEENRNKIDISNKKLDQVIDLLNDLCKSTIVGSELINTNVIKTLQDGFQLLRKDQLALTVLNGKK